jgi:hypothetical protein
VRAAPAVEEQSIAPRIPVCGKKVIELDVRSAAYFPRLSVTKKRIKAFRKHKTICNNLIKKYF